jgi:hypothetical protein
VKYFDTLYGPIELDDVIDEIVTRSWEVRRLKHIGLMNFRSLKMHPLTHCTRLEHAIGTAYLAQRFSDAQHLDARTRRALLSAALLHDISCSPFGHSIEWALMAQGGAPDHETASSWIQQRAISSADPGRPVFLDSAPFHPSQFGLDAVLFRKFVEGEPGHTHIASRYMDLDNLDNVFRMGHYLGLEAARREPLLRLVAGLSITSTADHFTIPEALLPDAKQWHQLRHDVYELFIYDPDYLSFEGQLFELVDGLLKILGDPGAIANLGAFPDDVLLWQYFTDPQFIDLRPLLRRLIALEPYKPLFIGRVEAPDICSQLPSASVIGKFRECFISIVLASSRAISDLPEGAVKRWIKALGQRNGGLPPPIHTHITTDKKKTHRQIVLNCRAATGNESAVVLGEDRLFVVAALMTEVNLVPRERDFIVKAFGDALTRWAQVSVEEVQVDSRPSAPQLQLTL